LRFRFKQLEGKEFKYPKLVKNPKPERPHRYFNNDELAYIFKLAEERLDIDVLVHVLYDMGARIQDVIGLTAGSLQASLGKGMDLQPKKAPQRRLTFLSDDTLDKIDRLAGGDKDHIVFQSSEDALGHALSLFYKTRGVKVTSHDFRKTRATNLYRYEHWTIL